MKNRLFTLWGVVAALVLGVACEQPDVPVEPQPDEALFSVNISSVSRGSVTFDVNPDSTVGDYICFVEERSVVEEFTQDKYIIQTVLQELTDEAYSKGLTLLEYMPSIVDNGPIFDCTFSGLKIDTEYVVILFGVDAEKEYEVNTDLVTVGFKTLAVEEVECDFNVTTSVVNNNVTINVDPTDKEVSWYVCLVTEEQYNYYVVDEDGYKMSEQGFYEYYFQQEINSLLQQGYSESQVIEALIHSGAQVLEAKGLHANTTYSLLIAGLILDSEGIVICTDIERSAFETKDAALSDMTFDIKVWDVGQMSANVRIVPSNNNDYYCALIQPWDGVSTADEVMNKIVNQWGPGWMDVMAQDKGVVEYSGSKAMKLPAADTDYYAIAFGYRGGITTEATMVTFRTLPGGSIDDVEFSITTSNVTPYGFNMNVRSSDPTIYYVPGACVEGEYDEAKYIAMEQEAIDYYYTETLKFNPSTSIAEVLDQYYFNGDRVVQASGLLPDMDVMAYVFAIDFRTGKIVKTFTFDKIAHTDVLGNVNPTVELVGYFSGDEEAGTIFKDANATKGKVITVVKYGNLDGAKTLYTSMYTEDYTNASNWPDNQLWAMVPEWKICKLDSPYTFYLTDWNLTQTAFAYATDANGKMGAIARVLTCPTADNKGDIEELRKLVSSLPE